MKSSRICRVIRLPGLTDYAEVLELQRGLGRARAQGVISDDLLLLVEHPDVITLGRGARESNVVAPDALLGEHGVEVHEVERGGDVTYHGPGQLVGYPVIDLNQHKKDLHWYLRQLEEVLIRTLAAFGVTGSRVQGYTGVWVGDRKIASIGVHVSRWVTWHGFALNVNTDLARFDLIIPCGIEAVQMTSLSRETNRACTLDEVSDELTRHFGDVFDLVMQPSDMSDIAAGTGAHKT